MNSCVKLVDDEEVEKTDLEKKLELLPAMTVEDYLSEDHERVRGC